YNKQVISSSPPRIWTSDYQNRPNSTEIIPFFRNFPDLTGSSLRRTGNALILGLGVSTIRLLRKTPLKSRRVAFVLVPPTSRPATMGGVVTTPRILELIAGV